MPRALLALVFLLLHGSMAYGHGGGLNAYGCHRQTSDNIYHCHDGPLDGRTFDTEEQMIAAHSQATEDPDSDPQPDDSGGGPDAYSRDDYMTSWIDHDSDCVDTRDEVLARESLVPPTFSESGCDVVSGLWRDLYTGQLFEDPSDLDIDHMVPLAEAHESGAYAWSNEKKSAYANDLLHRDALIAVSAGANRSKGARDVAEWLPPDGAYHCEYVKDWVAVKHRYALGMDEAEIAAIEDILGANVESALRAESGGIDIAGGQSAAIFGMGLETAGECAYVDHAHAQDEISLSVSITPEVEHLGQEIAVFLVAELPNGLFSLDSRGRFVPFNGDVDSLVPFTEGVLLRESREITVFSGVLNDTIDLRLFIGYQTASGDFVYTADPLPLAIVQ